MAEPSKQVSLLSVWCSAADNRRRVRAGSPRARGSGLGVPGRSGRRSSWLRNRRSGCARLAVRVPAESGPDRAFRAAPHVIHGVSSVSVLRHFERVADAALELRHLARLGDGYVRRGWEAHRHDAVTVRSRSRLGLCGRGGKHATEIPSPLTRNRPPSLTETRPGADHGSMHRLRRRLARAAFA